MSTIKANTLQNLAGSKSVPTDTVVDGSAKAWVNFNGTGTVAIRASFNVSSITDHGTGDYAVNFTNAMPDANYSVVATAEHDAGAAVYLAAIEGDVGPSASSIRLRAFVSNTVAVADTRYMFATIFR